jgi:hypothetical protein
LELVEDMARTLGYVSDVEQFAWLGRFVDAIKEVHQLATKTEKFIVQYCPRGELGMPFTSIAVLFFKI